jgi:hypothetical protein
MDLVLLVMSLPSRKSYFCKRLDLKAMAPLLPINNSGGREGSMKCGSLAPPYPLG